MEESPISSLMCAKDTFEGKLMNDGSERENIQEQPERRRGRPRRSHKTATEQEMTGQEHASRRQINEAGGQLISSVSLEQEKSLVEQETTEKRVTPFSELLRRLLKKDRNEIVRVARELDVSENTVYRWMNGQSEPRMAYLRRLLEVFPGQRENLALSIEQTFGSTPEITVQTIRETRKEIYQHILELLTVTEDADRRFWEIMHAIFTHGLTWLDTARRGVAMTFAKLTVPREDGIHALREVFMQGTLPWPHVSESGVLLGSTSLAGTAVEKQRSCFWDSSENWGRTQVEVDEFEQSACAVPLMRGNLIGGVLIVSSTQMHYFRDQMACQAVKEYALMMGIALQDQDYRPYEQLSLRPMPAVRWQRERILETYNGRVLAYARTQKFSRREAEIRVQREMESEFEQQARLVMEQTESHISTYK